jgi:hypothetical protein
MPLTCRECSHKNPREAVFCYFDGVLLDGSGGDSASISISVQGFTSPFFLPSGVKCRGFRELARACLQDRNAAYDLIKDGYLEPFLSGQGRIDLAMAVREAAKVPDRERGLDEFLAKLPGVDLEPARLEVDQAEVNLGTVSLGEDRRFELVLHNRGERLLFGKVAADNCPWLAFGESGSPEKLFQFSDRMVLPVQIRGQDLRAFGKPLCGEIILETNGGNIIVPVQVTVPVKSFPEGVMAGALSPRELAEKAKAAPDAAAPLIVNGAVARWYASNGWPYPVQGPTAAGVAAVQQLFEALGLVKPPHVELSETKVELQGRPGQRIEYVIAVVTPEKRHVVAHAIASEPWLEVGATIFRGRTATLPLTISSVPHEPGRKLSAELKISANGNQRFTVPVSLAVTHDSGARPAVAPASPAPVAAFVATPVDAPPSSVPVAAIALEPVASPESAPFEAMAVAIPQPTAAPRKPRSGMLPLIVRLLPVAIVVVGLLVAVLRDLIVPEGPQPEPPPYPTEQTLDIRFHEPTMRFGLVMLKESDPKDNKKFKRLTFREDGFTSNTCLMVGGTSVLFGDTANGVFEEPRKVSLGKDPRGRDLIGAKTVWVCKKIAVTQQVEIVADAQMRALDTCRITYTLENRGDVRQIVGLRYMLDTFIGTNDGVPFNIPGQGLCDSSHDFKKAEDVPDFVTAMERDDVKNPGTVAHVTLKGGGGLEPPSRVILGAWPDSNLYAKSQQIANKQDTLWEVPVLSMHDPALERPDSAVTIYWEPRELKSGDTRVVGFAYGLGEVSGDSGSLGLTLAGNADSFVAGGEFSLTAYVKDPQDKQTATLTLGSKRLSLVDGKETQAVPKLDPNVKSTYSPVTWKIRSTRGGRFELKVKLSTGAEQSIPVNIYSTGLMEGAARKK